MTVATTATDEFSTVREITSTRDTDRHSVEVRFMELFGRAPAPHLSKCYMIKRILWRLQEIRYGGIAPEAEALLDSLAASDPVAQLKPHRQKQLLPPRYAGSQTCTEWRGKEYAVTVLEDGKFSYDGRPFKSLSATAKETTGTHWNGKTFLGVK